MMSIGFMLPNPDDAVIWRGPRKNGLIKQFLKDVHWGSLDYLVIDSPPGTSDEHISIAQLLAPVAVDGAVVVTTPQQVSIIDVRKEINFCKKVRTASNDAMLDLIWDGVHGARCTRGEAGVPAPARRRGPSCTSAQPHTRRPP